MNTSNLNYDQAVTAMENGQFVALPEWGGFWFKMPEGVKAFTIPSVVAKAHITEPGYTGSEQWKIVDGLLNFGGALTVLNASFAVRRTTWSDEEYVFVRPADILARDIIGVVKSLPAMVKALLYREHKTVSFSKYFCKATGNAVANGWMPSTDDLFATDWVLATNVR